MAYNQIYYTAYKDDNAFFGPSGAQRAISCNHEKVGGDWYINNAGEVIDYPYSDSAIMGGYNYVDHGQVTTDKYRFSDTNFKKVYKIADFDSGICTYVDATSYDTNVVLCNQAPYPSICGLVTNLSAGTPGTTTATITFTAGVQAAGYEWVNQATPGVAPTTAGTLALSSPIALTGLTTGHAYRFWIRTICPANMQSAWQSLNFTTA